MKTKSNVNVQEHILVPKQIKLENEDVEKLLKKYNVSLSQLPKISINDAAISSLDVKHGDVIKIVRKSETAGESVFYRMVINE